MESSTFAQMLYANLVARSPIDTGNMQSSIRLEETPSEYIITIATDYAQSVNYNDQHTPKLRKNFEWVEKTIKSTAQLSGRIEDEL